MSCLPAAFSNIGNVLVVTSSTRPTGTSLYEGRVIYESDTDRLWSYDGTSWNLIGGRNVTARVRNSAVQSVSSGSSTQLLWDTEDLDDDALHSTSVNTGRLTIPSGLGGTYMVGYDTYCAAGGQAASAWIEKNADGIRHGFCQSPNDVTNGIGFAGSSVFEAAAGDYFAVYVFQNSGSSKNFNLVSPQIGRFWAIRMGPY